VTLETLDHKVSRVFRVFKVSRASKVFRVFKVKLEILVLKVSKVFREKLDLRVNRVFKERLVPLVQLGQKVTKEIRVTQVPLELVVR
jgi:hypothetical protein